MSRTYYVIELTATWLAVLLVVLAVLMVLAFAGGYGAAWSVLASGERVAAGPPESGATPVMETVEVESDETATVVPSVATPVPAEPTVTPAPGFEKPAPSPTRVPPQPTATPRPAVATTPVPTAVAAAPSTTDDSFWVQVFASGSMGAIEKARERLNDSGFPNENHKVVQARVAGGTTLLKLRVGPFPDRASADRVMARMQKAGFPDAWVVKP